MDIWSKKPAEKWEEYYPVGNGQLGAMISGGLFVNELILNDDRLYSEPVKNRINPLAKDNYQKVRQLLFDGKVKEAEELARATLFPFPAKPSHYEVLGKLVITDLKSLQFPKPLHYVRKLDLASGFYTAEAEDEFKAYESQIFTSLEDQKLYGKLSATKGLLSFDFQLTRQEEAFQTIEKTGESQLTLSGKSSGEKGRPFQMVLTIFSKDGTLTPYENLIRVENTSEIVFSIASYVEEESVASEKINGELFQAYLLQHIKIYQSYFNRTDFALLDKGTKDSFSTEERLTKIKAGEKDEGLINILFNYGKYLLISSSMPNTQAANLQGIWCQDINPRWGSRYTININTEMNYWLTGPLNLSELFEPFVALFLKAVEVGKKTAEQMYGLKGSVIHHNLDIYGDGVPQSNIFSATQWPLGGVWLANEIYEHAKFSGDQKLLSRVYPAMKELALFFDDFLAKDPQGYYAAAPSLSPENYYLVKNYFASLSYGTTMDNQLLRAFYKNLLSLAPITGERTQTLEHWQEILEKIRPTQITSDGRIMEWIEEYPQPDLGHRHFSHLYGLFPGNEFTELSDESLLTAAEKTIAYRLAHGSGQTGWSLGWVINLWSRLGAKDEALRAIYKMFQQSTQPNLLNSHPPFQIDGNFGFTNGICEMLLQSSPNEISLLPTLPSEWKTGFFKGWRTKNGALVDLTWVDGKITNLKIQNLKLDIKVVVATDYLSPEALADFLNQ